MNLGVDGSQKMKRSEALEEIRKILAMNGKDNGYGELEEAILQEMKKYSIISPDESGNCIEEVYTEKEILDSYFESWCKRMREVGKENQISEANCLEDWIVINWAKEV